MTASDNRLELAQAVLDRQLHWIAAADSKAAFAVAVDTAMFGGLAALAATKPELSNFQFFVSFLAGGLAAASILMAAAVVRSRTDGPLRSLFFFGRIASMERETYVDAFVGATDSELLRDVAAQIHRNAEIATEKHQWVTRSIACALGAGVAWVVAVAALAWY